MTYNLKVDEQFKSLTPPLSAKDYKRLEKNITKRGCREPLCVWNNTILDGHNRYEICTRLRIPFSIAYIFLKTREEAVSWICANQLEHRDLSREFWRYLIGKRYEAEKRIKKRTETADSIRERLGNEYRVSLASVGRYACYARSLDLLSKIEPGLAPKILSGDIYIPHDDIVTLAQFRLEDIKSVMPQLYDSPQAALFLLTYCHEMNPKRKMAGKPADPIVAIKETPAYDPDAIAQSLTFTVPSWVSSIERTATETDYAAISLSVRLSLKKALQTLTDTAQTMLDILEETACE